VSGEFPSSCCHREIPLLPFDPPGNANPRLPIGGQVPIGASSPFPSTSGLKTRATFNDSARLNAAATKDSAEQPTFRGPEELGMYKLAILLRLEICLVLCFEQVDPNLDSANVAIRN
jgi:hypothetical protein